MTEISISKGLVELKLLDKRIKKAIQDGIFVSMIRGKEKLTSQQIPTDKADKEIKATMDSVTTLIQNRKDIKSAIVDSNANTTVRIGENDYTVAEAIERKNSIIYERTLLEMMIQQLATIVQEIERKNDAVEDQLNEHLENLMSGETKIDKDTMNSITTAFRDNHQIKLFDPIQLRNKIQTMEEEISRFEADVDIALSESNARTNISI